MSRMPEHLRAIYAAEMTAAREGRENAVRRHHLERAHISQPYPWVSAHRQSHRHTRLGAAPTRLPGGDRPDHPHHRRRTGLRSVATPRATPAAPVPGS